MPQKHSSSTRYSRMVAGYLLIYIIAWTTATSLFDPAVPYDAIEALSWGSNAEFGSPKNPYMVGAVMAVGKILAPIIPLNVYWYLSHFVGVSMGMLGVWLLSRRLFGDNEIALLAFMSLNLSSAVNFDTIPYNDNYLLITLWPYIFLFFVKAIFDRPGYWFALAIAAGLAAMSKYSSFVFLPFMFLYTLWSPVARRAYRAPWIYLAILLYLLILAPNALWLSQHDYAAFHWVHSEIDRGLNRDAVMAMLAVFYPALVLLALLLTRGGAFRWPNTQERLAVPLVFLPPVVLIVVYFTLHSGARPTEWLQPFAMLTPVVLFSCLDLDKVKTLRHVSIFFAGIAFVFCVVYTLILQQDIRGAGTKFKYIKNLGAEVNAIWRAKYHTPLKYVGGSHFSQWMTFYAPDHPRTTTPWSNEQKPNVYNAQLSVDDVLAHGALFVSDPGGACDQNNFEGAMANLPGVVIVDKQTFSFRDEKGELVTLCLGFAAPRAVSSPTQ